MDCPKTNQPPIDTDEPKTVSGDQGSVTNHDLSQQIEADRYNRSDAATKSPASFLRSTLVRLQPPSARGS